jgi:decaprenylphospho-beta-D-erythro-pentofuranosid-2-ulose 2-reductase
VSAESAGSAGRRVIVLGGSSQIALAIVHELQRREPREIALVGRDREALARAAQAVQSDGAPAAVTVQVDALQTDRHAEAVSEAFERLGGADIVILAVGVLGERGGMPSDVAGALQVLEVNALGAGSLLIQAARRLQEAGGGALVVLSSVAAERPRRGNAVYGASKAGIDSLAQALGDDLREENVRVLVVRPGFVHTRMTEGLQPAPLATTPQAVARAVVDGLDHGAHTVWAPRSLRWLMLVVRMLPRRILRRIKQ